MAVRPQSVMAKSKARDSMAPAWSEPSIHVAQGSLIDGVGRPNDDKFQRHQRWHKKPRRKKLGSDFTVEKTASWQSEMISVHMGTAGRPGPVIHQHLTSACMPLCHMRTLTDTHL